MSASKIYQIKATLVGFQPPIWRRLLISADATFFDLHSVIQDAFGWEDYHLHAFRAQRNKGRKRIFIQDDEADEEWRPLIAEELLPPPDERDEFLDEYGTPLSACLNPEFPKMEYEYDFGDSWSHTIILEKVLSEPPAGMAVPAVIAGKRIGPPEDSRGWIHNAEEILKASRNKKSRFWRELVENWDEDVVHDFVRMSRDFLQASFEPGAVELIEPKERRRCYDD